MAETKHQSAMSGAQDDSAALREIQESSGLIPSTGPFKLSFRNDFLETFETSGAVLGALGRYTFADRLVETDIFLLDENDHFASQDVALDVKLVFVGEGDSEMQTPQNLLTLLDAPVLQGGKTVLRFTISYDLLQE